MVSLFWLALLAGRGLGSAALVLFARTRRSAAVAGLGLTAVTVLLEPHSTLRRADHCGFGGSSIRPRLPSRCVAPAGPRERTPQHRIVFAICAGGGAVLPWLTGLVSTRTGSLRLGFAVPVAAVAAILILALLENSILLRQTSALREPA